MIDAKIKLTLRELKYDLKFDSWLREKIANELLHNTSDDVEDINYAYKNDKAEDWLVRQIQDAVDNVYGELNWCIVENVKDIDDSICEKPAHRPTEWLIEFNFSNDWRGSMRSLRSHISTYVREYVLSQWYRAAMPQNLSEYQLKAEDALRKAYNEARSEVVYLEPWRL